jgi:signal transduction histidine kinase
MMHSRGHLDHLAAVVGSMLLVARTASRGDTLELSFVPVRELLAEVFAVVEPFAASRRVSLVVDCEHAPTVVRGERTALLWVLLNLAGHVVSLTPSGGSATLSAVALPNAVELRVADSGAGTPISRRTAVLGPFVQEHVTGE